MEFSVTNELEMISRIAEYDDQLDRNKPNSHVNGDEIHKADL